MCAQQQLKEGNTHVAVQADKRANEGWALHFQSATRDTCSFVWLVRLIVFFHCANRPTGSTFTAHLYGWMKLVFERDEEQGVVVGT